MSRKVELDEKKFSEMLYAYDYEFFQVRPDLAARKAHKFCKWFFDNFSKNPVRRAKKIEGKNEK